MSQHILLVVGSLRKHSFNKTVADHVANKLVQEGHKVSFLNYSQLPIFSQDIEYPVPSAVKAARDEVIAADAIWFFTPEYNAALPGGLKNLLDWLSRPTAPELYGQPTIINGKKATTTSVAGRSKGNYARQQLINVLEKTSMHISQDVESGLSLPAEAFKTGEFTISPEQQIELDQHIEKFIEFLNN